MFLAKEFSSHSILATLSWQYVSLVSSSSLSCSTRKSVIRHGFYLLELCATLLVDTSSASSSVLIKSVTRALMMIFFAVSGCSNVFLSISINAEMLVMTESSPCLCGRWELALETCKLLSVWLAVGRTHRPTQPAYPATNFTQLHVQHVTVLPRFKAIDEFHTSRCQE